MWQLMALFVGLCWAIGGGDIAFKYESLMVLAYPVIGGCISGFAQIMFQTAMKLGSPSAATALAGSYPVMLYVIGLFLGSEKFSRNKIIGSICILAGGYFFALPEGAGAKKDV